MWSISRPEETQSWSHSSSIIFFIHFTWFIISGSLILKDSDIKYGTIDLSQMRTFEIKVM